MQLKSIDFRDGKTFPRRGRDQIGPFLWLARAFDKGRAHANGTIHDYIYPCPLDKRMFDQWGISAAEFDGAVRACASDEAILEWMRERVPDATIASANAWLTTEKRDSLDRQDREEGALG